MPRQQQQAPAPQPTTAAGYAQSLLSRFNLPSSSSTTTAGPGTAQGLVVGGDWYSLVTTALGAVTSPSSSSTTAPSSSSPQTREAQLEQLSASGNLLHPDRVAKLSRAEKARYYSSQRERLEVLVSALEREESKLTPTTSNSNSSDDDEGLAYGSSNSYASRRRKTSLRKNGSENSFDQIDADDLSGSTSQTSKYNNNNNNSNNNTAAVGGWTSGWFGGSSNTAARSKRTVSSESSSGVEFAARAVDEIGRASGFTR